MTVQRKRNRPSFILMAAPTLLVLIGFYAFFFKETRRQLIARRSELQSLEVGRDEVTRQIRSIQAEMRSINQDLHKGKQQQQRVASAKVELTREQRALGDQVTSSVGQAETMNQLTAMVLERGLAIVSNESLPSVDRVVEEENQTLLEQLEYVSASAGRGRRDPGSIVDDLSSADSSPAGRFVAAPSTTDASVRLVGSKRQHVITVQGSFAQIKKTVQRVSENFPSVMITSVELKPVDLRSDVRNWKLSILL